MSATKVDRRTIIRRRRVPSVLLLLGVFCFGTLFADRIELKTGEVFFGKILRANRREVSMQLDNGGVLSFRMTQVGYFRKNFVASDEWSPVLVIDDANLDGFVVQDFDDTSFQGSPSTPVDLRDPDGTAIKPAGDLNRALVRPAIQASRGFRVSPPRDFLDWENSDGSAVKRFYDPVTQARLDITDLGPRKASLESIKTKITRVRAADATPGREVLKDQQVRDARYEGWYFEFQEAAGGSSTHQIWLFAKGKHGVLLLKYSCPEEHYEEFRRSFAESIRSFSPTETGDFDPESITPPEQPEKPPEDVDPAEELLRLLKRNRDSKTSRRAVDEYLKQDAARDR